MTQQVNFTLVFDKNLSSGDVYAVLDYGTGTEPGSQIFTFNTDPTTGFKTANTTFVLMSSDPTQTLDLRLNAFSVFGQPTDLPLLASFRTQIPHIQGQPWDLREMKITNEQQLPNCKHYISGSLFPTISGDPELPPKGQPVDPNQKYYITFTLTSCKLNTTCL